MYPIINNEKGRSKLVVRVEQLLMLVGTLLVWYFFLKYVVRELGGTNTLKSLDAMYFLIKIAGLIVLVLSFWQSYNIYLYRNKDRRESRGRATDELVGAEFGIEPEKIPLLRKAEYVEVSRGDNFSEYLLGGGTENILMRMTPNRERKRLDVKGGTR